MVKRWLRTCAIAALFLFQSGCAAVIWTPENGQPPQASPRDGQLSRTSGQLASTVGQHFLQARRNTSVDADDAAELNVHVDKLAQPFFEVYFFVYWGTAFGVLAFLLTSVHIWERSLCAAEEGEEEEDAVRGFVDPMSDSGFDDLAGIRSASSMLLGHQNELTLAESMWTLCLVASLGQAKWKRAVFRKRDWPIPAPIIASGSVIMGCSQFWALALIVHDLNPAAKPITEVPSTDWKTEPWTVNSMKWLMCLYICVSAVGEAVEAKKFLAACFVVNHHRLKCSRIVPVCCAIFQYVVVLFVIWAGISATLSLHSVPEILYSSMAILFILNIDEIVYKFCAELFDIDADFQVVRPSHSCELEHGSFPLSVEIVFKFFVVLPLLWGIFVLARAWRTNIMPTDRVHSMRAATDKIISQYWH